jgi:hypothetical protein
MQTFALMWDRDRRMIGQYINKWAPKWGKMGRYLSNLDITESFLDATLPESYRAVGLTKICGVPDGKHIFISIYDELSLLINLLLSSTS